MSSIQALHLTAAAPRFSRFNVHRAAAADELKRSAAWVLRVAWFNDLSPCGYLGEEFAPFLRAVGWLERGKPFVTAERNRAVFEKLIELCKDPWQPAIAMGSHGCDLCNYEPERLGSKNLFVPGGDFLYVSPVLIVHYMNAHGYGPPLEFCDAVLACPAMRSMEYKKAILASGGRPLVK